MRLLIVLFLFVVSVIGAPSVAVLGGGVSGLSAAHELVDRGFSVQVPILFIISLIQ